MAEIWVWPCSPRSPGNRVPRLRAHANEILFFRTICDFGFSVMWMYYMVRNFIHDIKNQSDDDDKYWVQSICTNHHGKEENQSQFPTYLGDFLALLFQFTTMSSEAWFLCISLDLKTSIGNPFASFKENMRRSLHSFRKLSASIIDPC